MVADPVHRRTARRVRLQLADRYHLIAPDHLGFGFSDAPPVAEFDYTFDALTDLTAGLLDQLALSRHALCVHNYGAPIGWRLALRRPEAISAITTQNGNGYDAGFVDSFWKAVWDYQREQNADTEAAVRAAPTVDAIKWQYLTGVPVAGLVMASAVVAHDGGVRLICAGWVPHDDGSGVNVTGIYRRAFRMTDD